MAERWKNLNLLRYGSIGIEFVLTFGAGVAAGFFTDRWLNSLPGFTLIGTAVGFGIALKRLAHQGKQIEKEVQQKLEEDRRERDRKQS